MENRDPHHPVQPGSSEMSKANAAKKEKGAAFGNLGDMMGMDGMSSVLSAVSDAGRPSFAIVHRSDIKVYAQQRNKDELETEEQTLDELGADMRQKGILQPLILCENEDGPEPWRLVAGERRYHGSDIADIHDLPSMCYGKLTEQQIKDIQLAENIHRLNLSQLNEAKVLKNRLDDEFGGDVEALCTAISKSRSWVSKRLALLEMPEQTQRLVREGITADIEVINQVRTIEKINPEAAEETVNTLKNEKGQKGANARETVKAAKDKVKPPKAPRKDKNAPTNPENVATPRDESHKENGPVNDVPPATLANDPALQALQEQFAQGAAQEEQAEQDSDRLPWEEPEATGTESTQEPEREPLDTSKVPALPPVQSLANAYAAIYEKGADVKGVLSAMPEEERDGVENWLNSFYDAGVDCENLALAVVQGLRNGSFATEGHGSFALVAFLSGGEEGVKFNLLNIMGTVKA
ncbi:ParB/RepB/Spo0J family partition protein [Pseudomonas aeruginosa]|uniref:ParB/RepB/Spo0J family partition protein n=1 Tax=Pseudomonas aeruginosa TaxID=287 RepID=UPI001379F94A|nr:ParB/RepB/Spo0J family partition protein [Pseudomonas aeruginosa]